MINNYGYGQPHYFNSFTQGIKGRPVSSIDEVKAAQIDFDGSLFIFPDVVNKRIYTKQINMDGTASLNMYELAPLPQSTTEETWVTKEELEKALMELRDSLMTKEDSAKKVVPQVNF